MYNSHLKKSNLYFILINIICISCNTSDIRTYTLPKQNLQNRINNNDIEGKKLLFKWVKPNSWIATKGASMRLASFSVPLERENGDLSLIVLNGDGGGIKLNVNRWRRQLGMDPVEFNQIEQDIIVYKGKLGEYHVIKIINDDKNSFYCAILPIENQTLFVKLSIHAEFINDVEQDFIQFCSSIEYSN